MRASFDVRWHQEREHPLGARRAPGEVDRGGERPLHPHWKLRPPQLRRGLAVHQREVVDAHGRVGWKSLGVLELTVLPSIDRDRWVPWLRADVLFLGGGDALYLGHWMRESGLADLLRPTGHGLGGDQRREHGDGAHIGQDFVQWKSPGGGERSALWTSRSSRTSTIPTCRKTRWAKRSDGRP